MREELSIPIMVTGGLRRREVMNHVLETGGADMIGLGRPLCVDADGPNRLLNGEDGSLATKTISPYFPAGSCG